MRGSDDVEVIHIPNPGPGFRDSRSPPGGSQPPSGRTTSSTTAITTSGVDGGLTTVVRNCDLPADGSEIPDGGRCSHAASPDQTHCSNNPKVNVSVSIETVCSDTIDESRDTRVVSTSTGVPDVVKSASKKASKP